MTNIRALLAPLALSAASLAQGRVVVAHDEWTLSNNGFAAAPASTAPFALNVADGFTGGQPGNLRVCSSDFGLAGSQASQAMTGAGHNGTVATSGTFNLATLQLYDADILGVNPTTSSTDAPSFALDG